MGIKAIVFDMDGVIVDPVEAAYHAFVEVSELFGLRKPERNDVRMNIGLKIEKMIENIFGHEDSGRIKEALLDSYLKFFPVYGRIIDSADKTIPALKYKKAIVSNSSRHVVEYVLGRFSLLDYFDVIIAADDVRHEKPDPEPILKAISMLNVSRNEVVFVGDTRIDMMTANKAGVRFVAVLSGIGKRDDFNGCDIIRDIGELYKVIQ